MLESLELENVGPAPRMKLDLAPRLNLLTGDNGLGKSFLLDVAWWTFTRRWPRDVNRRMTAGFPARPHDAEKPAAIRFRGRGRTAFVEHGATYSTRDEAWKNERARPWRPGPVVYAHADGSFSVWDPARNYYSTPQDDADGRRPPPAYVFTEAEVWDGLRTDVAGRPVPICNGLLYDWPAWLRARDVRARAVASALKALSPGGDEDGVIEAGRPVRLSIDDARDVPTIRTPHAGPVPILHASSGVRRACTLAYMLTWAWSEHRFAAGRLGEQASRRVAILFDEVESHLHPRWQRSILAALRDLGKVLFNGAELQLLVTTHSPLVLASAEPWFHPAKDAWFDLDLDRSTEPPRARLERRSYTPRGGAGDWLTSEAFGLATDRGSMEAERAILCARALLRRSEPPLDEVMEVHARLRAVLPDVDRFWVRWNAFVERRGGIP